MCAVKTSLPQIRAKKKAFTLIYAVVPINASKFFHNRYGMLELSGKTAVPSSHCPAVGVNKHVIAACVDHWFDGNNHTFLQLKASDFSVIVLPLLSAILDEPTLENYCTLQKKIKKPTLVTGGWLPIRLMYSSRPPCQQGG